MKKKFGILALGAASLSLVSCGSGAEFELEMGLTSNTTSNEYKAAELLANTLNEKSDGRIELKLFPSAQLGNDLEMIEMTMRGGCKISP